MPGVIAFELLCENESESNAKAITQLAANEAWRIEDKFSRYLSGNIVKQINTAAGAPVEVDSETARLIEFSITLHTMSEGRFDITSGVLRKVWTFDGSDHVPTASAVHAARKYVGWHRVRRSLWVRDRSQRSLAH